MEPSAAAPIAPEELARALRAALPPEQRPLADELAALIAAGAAGEPATATPALRPALRTLAGRELALERSVLAFGAGNQFGDVTIGDVVSGDQLTVQIALTQARGLRLTAAIAAATLLVSLVAAAALLWPAVAGPGPMDGLFNVAVADFGRVGPDGQVGAWADGARLSGSIALRLAQEFAAADGLGGVVQVRHERVGLITGRTPGERAERARRRAAELGAHVLIYGSLDGASGEARFVPQFYIGEQAFANAEELVGSERLGAPVPVAGAAPGLGAGLQLGDSLQARTRALTLFVVGLAYFVSGDEARAGGFFERAAAVEGWDDPEGKEVIYLFLGSAHKAGGDPAALERAREAYERARSLNGEYARAYIGLGNVAYEQFRAGGNRDVALIGEAIAWYERAAQAKVQPAQAYADVKILISLGNGYLARAQLGRPGDFAAAAQYYQVVADAYAGGAADLASYASQAHFGLGVIAERRDGDPAAALAHYRLARDLAGDGGALRRQAEGQIAALEAATPTP